ncbi:GDP-L-fucose synthase [Crocinitomicaceae bacterium]|nr:GDP-L-fucose synthase [Crocinitomicaceae bacterium]
MKILLTGAGGFLGRNVLQYFNLMNITDGSAWNSLSDGSGGTVVEDASELTYNVIPVSSKVYDLRDSYACRKVLDHYRPDVIVHAAGSVGGIMANKENPGKFMYDNLAMGMNMLERTRQYRDKGADWVKFVMLGTVCAYPKFTPVPFRESELWNGYPEETNAPYGIAKKTLMKLGETYHEQYGMNITNLIPVNMYGPHDHFNLTSSHVIPALILKFHNAIKNGETQVNIWGTGEATREFLYAGDCAQAIHCAINSDVGPEPINIGTGDEIKIVDLVEVIADLMGYEGFLNFDHSKPDGQPRRCLETSRAIDRLGFKAETDIRSGLKHTIQWFKENN